ncbi:MAG: Ku protein [Clostridium sp.]|jgi:DNA end-binding protein Ku|nr:Ku protein [Clostridium sp.]
MRSIWKGAISFGLVNIPVDLFSAQETHDLKFHLIDDRDESRIRYERVNESTGKEVPKEHIVKAFEFENGEYVVMTDEDFEKADVEATKTVDIESFILKEELSFMYLEKPYYMMPRKGGEKAYVLLKQALDKSEKIAIARVVIRTRAYLAAVYPLGDLMVLNLIRFHEELRSAEELRIKGKVTVKEKEMDMALKLIEDMSVAWNPEEYEDEYEDALMKRIEAKSKKKIKDVPEEDEEETEESSNVVDIMELLKKSVEERPKTAKSKPKSTPEKKVK